jgi:hypothetical protein
MFRKTNCLALGAFALLGAAALQAHDDVRQFRPVPQIDGAWKTRVSIVDCLTRKIVFAGPFAGLITFTAGGTISESGPALPNTARGPGHGTWRRTGRNTFSETMIFQRFDLTGVYLGPQEIRATVKVSDDSRTYLANDGTFEIKDAAGTVLTTGCSAVTAERY